MTDKELIEFGNKLIKKGRTSIEIFNALAYKSSSKEQLNRVHKQVIKPEAIKKKRSPELVKKLLQANRIKLKSDYSIESLIRLAFLVLGVGGIVLFLSNEEVNGNAFYGWTTLVQGICLLVFYYMVKYRRKMDFLLIALTTYLLIWVIELLVGGIPNDLLEAYNGVQVRTTHIRQVQKVGGARVIGYLFPYLYIGVKFVLCWFVVTSYFNYRKYDSLPNDIKLELEEF